MMPVPASPAARLWALSLLWGAAATACAQGTEPLPLRNLQVELRQVEMLVQTRSVAPGSGARITGTVHATNAPAGSMVYRALPQTETSWLQPVTQRLTVLNGRSGTLRLSQAAWLQWLQPAWQSDGTVAVLPGVAWAEAVNQLTVRPHWPGGQAPVTLALGLVSAGLPADPVTGETGRAVHTTVTVPLDQWTPVATVVEGHAPPHPVAGSLDSRDAQPVRRTVIQVRVSLP
jgi:hypothetical protein